MHISGKFAIRGQAIEAGPVNSSTIAAVCHTYLLSAQANLATGVRPKAGYISVCGAPGYHGLGKPRPFVGEEAGIETAGFFEKNSSLIVQKP